MKKNTSDNRYQYNTLHPPKRQYKSSSVTKEVQQSYNKTLLSDNSINFDINCFPFTNEESKMVKTYRSTVRLKLSEEQLRKIARLNHVNLINIMKITSGYSKLTSKTYEQEVYYSFYYQQVSYSLKYVAMYQESLNNLLKKMAEINLTKLLVNLTDYLMKFGIFYVFNLADIGVNKQGQIKIYVSPMHFCEQSSNKIHKSQIYGSIDKIVAWWQTTLASNTALNPRSSHIILPSQIGLQDQTSIDYINKDNQLSFIHQEISQILDDQQDKVYNQKPQIEKGNFLNNSNKYTKSDLQNSQNLNKIKKLDQQIKYIRQKLIEKRKKHKTSDSFLQNKDRNRLIGKGLIQSDRFQKKEYKDVKDDKNGKQDSNIIETIQQNINCINIYTHPKQNSKEHHQSRTKTKKMTSQPIYSYKISPQNIKEPKIKVPQVIIHHPSFDPQDFPNSESISSIDTYDMEVGAQIQPAKAVQKNNHFVQQRQISEKNYRPSFESQQTIKKSQNQNQNQVANKHVTESAGPLQFKNFVNKYIKPQFLAKKSNIYEDPLEYESETSKSISKKKKKIITDLYENGKSANSHTQKSSSLNNNQQQPSCKKKDNHFFVVNNISPGSPHQNTKNIYNRTNSELRLMTVLDEKNESQFQRKNKCLNESKINQRVKLVLQKTKNAIALLNRVKNCRSPQFNEKGIPHKSSQLY